ncbi:hemoglobin subunit zeta-like [Artibeus jamaicensis]|uniref:hemoglobin subunit zeta-like n=1 Tax=Artibeus jamaicensis TaxID=9417 RepID=UPI00235A79D0|nr:hemoglobin subunit zeta-like [Artibeus jamaicensis]
MDDSGVIAGGQEDLQRVHVGKILAQADASPALRPWRDECQTGCDGARLFTSFPQTKTYFPHFDLHPGSAHLHAHGSKVVAAVDDAVKNIDNIARRAEAGPQCDQGSLLSHCLLVTVASHFPADFTADAHAAWDKFLSVVSSVLTEKYR